MTPKFDIDVGTVDLNRGDRGSLDIKRLNQVAPAVTDNGAT